MGVGPDRRQGGDAGADVDHPAPFGEARAALVIGREPFAQAVQALGNGLAGKAGQGLGPLVDLDAGDGAGGGDQVDQRRSIGRVLPDGLVEEDDARDVVLQDAGRAEQQFAIVAAILFGGLHPDGVEPRLDRAEGFVGGQQPLARGDQPLGDVVQSGEIHRPPRAA